MSNFTTSEFELFVEYLLWNIFLSLEAVHIANDKVRNKFNHKLNHTYLKQMIYTYNILRDEGKTEICEVPLDYDIFHLVTTALLL